ncbi:MAG TPA: hypothetical protein VD839_12595 [Burkholderiales bacterium]|nr:hypothetical protein [Burkholderiales bacterium]
MTNGAMGLMMNSMMGWMMTLGSLGWVLVIALLVAIVVLLVRLLSRTEPKDDRSAGAEHT